MYSHKHMHSKGRRTSTQSKSASACTGILIYNGHNPFGTSIMLDFGALPSSPGAYVLHLSIQRPQRLAIGRLGQYRLPAGHYFYMGSARGAGGLRARVGRHLRGDGALRWHVDYVRAVAEVREVFYTVADKSLECVWSRALARLPQAFIPVPHFGSSDCRSGCDAHLIAFLWEAELAGVPRVLEETVPTPLVPLRLI